MVSVIKSHLRAERQYGVPEPRVLGSLVIVFWSTGLNMWKAGPRPDTVTPFSVTWTNALNLSEPQFPDMSKGL